VTSQRPFWENQSTFARRAKSSGGFSVLELLVTMVIGMIMAAVTIPMIKNAMASMRINSTVGAISGVISSTRYRALANSQIYTLAITTPANTYVVTNVSTTTADYAGKGVPLPNAGVALNGGVAATYTFTLCPNGTVSGAGGACPGGPAPPALVVTYQGRQTNLNVSTVGNVTTTFIK